MGGIDAEHLREVPGDRLPLAIQVGGEPDLAGSLGQPAEFGDGLGLVVVDFIGRGEIVVEIDTRNGLFGAPRGLARQVADVADRGFHDESRAEILLDGLRLGGALDDHELEIALRRGRGRFGTATLRGRSLGGLFGHRENVAWVDFGERCQHRDWRKPAQRYNLRPVRRSPQRYPALKSLVKPRRFYRPRTAHRRCHGRLV